jgi:shikimate dehydrogenase
MPDFYSFGLVGYPVEHSLSPRLHTAALQELHLAGEYQLFPIDRPSGLHDILEKLRSGKIHGLNVTIPYKTMITSLIDELTPAAQAIGAVNTVSFQGDLLVGDNTDEGGFLADLKRLGWLQIGEPERDALILGAGGSARAVVYALVNANWRVTIAARRQEQAVFLVEMIQRSIGYGENEKKSRLFARKLNDESLDKLNPKPSLIVNTTPVGMYPQIEASPWPEELDFPSQAAIYDLVYNPAVTTLMQEAQKMDLRVSNGIGMLVEQAACSLEIWTGLKVPRQVMHQAVVEYSEGMI